jgi:hypothetical protein
MHAEPSLVRFVIVGIGLNVNQEKFPGDLGTGDLPLGNGKAGFAAGTPYGCCASLRTTTIDFCGKGRLA